LIFYQKYSCSSQVSGRISGIRPLPDIQPDIQYAAFGLAGYPAGGYPAKTVFGASLVFTVREFLRPIFGYPSDPASGPNSYIFVPSKVQINDQHYAHFQIAQKITQHA
jgi:hypothetical protein